MATMTIEGQTLDYLSRKLYHGSSPLVGQQPAFANDQAPPSGFPTRYEGERTWTGQDMNAREEEWLTTLSDQDHDQIVKALRHFQGLHLSPQDLSRETFPLSHELSYRLNEASRDCYSGRGFAVLRGIRTEEFTEAENVIVFGGVSSHVAPVRGFQDADLEMVTCHVFSEELRPESEKHNLKPAFTNGPLAFHTDLGDILALYTIDAAESGGRTTIASSSTLYNELADSRPDLLQELAKPWVYYSSQDFHAESAPLASNVAGDKLVFQYSRLPITGFRKHGPNRTIPQPSAKRLEAMSLVEELAWKHCLRLPGKKGDIAYINNLTLMHARDAFDVTAEGRPLPSKRHLVKLMLQDPSAAWELPQSLRRLSDRIYGPNRADGERSEKWQMTIDAKDPLTGGHVWAGSGNMSNG